MRLLLVCVLAALVAPTVAAAQEPPTTTPLYGLRYTDSLAIAVAFWGAQPACTVQFYSATTRELDAFTGKPHTGAAVRSVQQGDTCPVWIGPDYEAKGYEERIWICGFIVHEDGHLLGVTYPDNTADPAHSLDPRSVMFAVGPPLVYGCYRRFLPHGRGVAWRELYGPPVWATH